MPDELEEMPLESWGHLMGAWTARERRKLEGAAMICSVLANVNRDPKTKREPFTIDDFLPPKPLKARESKETDWDQVQRNMQAFVNKQNGNS